MKIEKNPLPKSEKDFHSFLKPDMKQQKDIKRYWSQNF